MWEKVGLCRFLSPGWAEGCDWKLAQPWRCFTPSQLVALHHPSLQGQAGASMLAKGEGRDQARVKVSNVSRDARGKCITGSREPAPC